MLFNVFSLIGNTTRSYDRFTKDFKTDFPAKVVWHFSFLEYKQRTLVKINSITIVYNIIHPKYQTRPKISDIYQTI